MNSTALSQHPAEPLPASPHPRWRQILKEAVRDPDELCRLLELPAEYAAAARKAARQFPLFVPRGYLARMTPGDIHDPLLRQVLPVAAEQEQPQGFSVDPVGDAAATTTPGLISKYRGRSLIVTTGACAVHCRYCFRRHFPYSEGPRSIAEWQRVLDLLSADATLREAILSGGDPLTMVDPVLAELVDRLAAIPHLKRLRIHTRLPVVIPERVDDDLLAWLRGSRLTTLVVLHANHARELDDAVAAAVGRLVDSGVPVLNQAVLLRGVNDSLAALEDLCQRLVELRVMPYYLHQLDRVAGAAHFEVPEEEGRRLTAQLHERLPGYAVPRYVREQAGSPHKLSLE